MVRVWVSEALAANKRHYAIPFSQVVPQPSTDGAQCRLTSSMQFLWEVVYIACMISWHDLHTFYCGLLQRILFLLACSYGSQVWSNSLLHYTALAGRQEVLQLAVYASFAFSEGHFRCEAGYRWLGWTPRLLARVKGHEPQFYWFWSAVKLFNSMPTNTNGVTLRRGVQADRNLQPLSSACWTAQLLSTFQGLRGY